MMDTTSLIGKQFGQLTVLDFAGEHRRRSMWQCRCECGSLVTGNTKSCGKHRVSHNRIGLAGRQFGRLTVVESAGTKKGRALWLCRCECGGSVTTYASYLLCGDTRSCGCLHSEVSAAK